MKLWYMEFTSEFEKGDMDKGTGETKLAMIDHC